nr:dna-3-methyladenine glycosylase [Quercus suber]
MPIYERILAKNPPEVNIISSFDSSTLLPSHFAATKMSKTQRFKRVGKLKQPISSTELEHETRPSLRSKAVTIRAKPKPEPRLNPFPILDIPIDKLTILPPEFCQIDSLDLAPRLLGKLLRKDDVVLQITEVEAYRPNDSACHGRFGITARTAPVFGAGGHAYVYLCYGLHSMLNVVADKEGVGAAVLIRSCSPICGSVGYEMPIYERIRAKNPPEVNIISSFDSSTLLPSHFAATKMSKTQRFKRVGKLKQPISATELEHETRPSLRSKAVTIRAKPKPEPRLKPFPILDIPIDKLTILPPEFCQIDSLELAPRLLGKLLRKDDVVLQITEVEAYRPNDSACHGRFGITARTAPVFGAGGHAYVYLCYGLHSMLNVVADKEGVGAAVLIRSCAPICGLETIQQRRGQKTDKPVLLSGPGKVGQALGLTTEWSNHCLYTPGGLELLDGPEPEKILIGPRVGIEYALPEHVNALWRFAIAGTPWISAPKNTLRPPSSFIHCSNKLLLDSKE